jgi:glycosyltransferase involved in cell wall biosynthesis
MEAMAWGKPVIATKHAGNPELVDEILIEERNVEQLKNAIEYLLNNPGKWQQMGENNRKIIASKYSKDNVKKLVSIFEDVAK